MLTLGEIIKRLHHRKLDVVSRATHLHKNSIARIRDGKNANPTLSTMLSLSAYLESNQ